jgi:hypothetical protein
LIVDMEDEYFRIMPNERDPTHGYPEADLTSPACVWRGAQWLDNVRPEWPLLITEPIQLLTFNQCICGQVFKEECQEGAEGYLWAKLRYEHEWRALQPWWMQEPNTSRLYTTPGIYLGFKGGVGAEIAWVKEASLRRGGLLAKEIGL